MQQSNKNNYSLLSVLKRSLLPLKEMAMRTWKQGRIGKLKLSDLDSLFIKCLKYPIAQFYLNYDSNKQVLDDLVFEGMIQKSVLKNIETIGQQPLTKEERRTFRNYEKENEKVYNSEKRQDLLISEEKATILTIDQIKERYQEVVIAKNSRK